MYVCLYLYICIYICGHIYGNDHIDTQTRLYRNPIQNKHIMKELLHPKKHRTLYYGQNTKSTTRSLDATEWNGRASNYNTGKDRIQPIILLTETWECNLSRTQLELKGYKYLGKPIDKPPQATRGHEGTGVWVKPTIANQCSVVTPSKMNPNIL